MNIVLQSFGGVGTFLCTHMPYASSFGSIKWIRIFWIPLELLLINMILNICSFLPNKSENKLFQHMIALLDNKF